MIPTIRKFTRNDRCTKLHIWNLFRGRCRFQAVRVAVAHSQIGVNVPRDMESAGRLTVNRTATGDYYVLTDDGAQWLIDGMRRYIRNHPSCSSEVLYPLREWGLR